MGEAARTLETTCEAGLGDSSHCTDLPCQSSPAAPVPGVMRRPQLRKMQSTVLSRQRALPN
eukprot:225562-Pyramimonas_sp.AAC.1